MTSRCAKSMLVLLALALGLGFAARTIAAPAAGLNWEVHGTGSGSASLTAVSSSGPTLSQHVGNSTYSLSLSTPGTVVANGVGGVCEFITGSGSVTAANGSTINFATVGTLCDEAGGSGEGGPSPLHYNGTFRITTGDGRFIGVAGGGSLTATFNSTHFIKIDGTITSL